jgi:hypothetical protein
MKDLSKYKAFPVGYIPTKVIEAIKIAERDGIIEFGAKGKIVPDGTDSPYFYPDDKSLILDNHAEDWVIQSTFKLAPLNPQDHPDYKQEQPEWQPKMGEGVYVFPNEGPTRIFLFKDNIGYWCVMGGLEDLYRKGEKFEIFCQKEVWQVKPEPIKLTRAEIAEKLGTDNFEIID